MQVANIKTNIIEKAETDTCRKSREAAATVSAKANKKVRPFSYRFWKNIMDRFLALAGIIVAAPVMGIIALIIKFDSKGSAIYRREQVGENGDYFTAFKFRTMTENNDDSVYREYMARYIKEGVPYAIDEEGKPVYKVINDTRVTRFGALLRKTNLDELPQLFNILRGEMSWVGPRPDVPLAVSMYQAWHMKRLAIRPGLTGLWQVSGRKNLNFQDMVRLDIEYIRKQSLLLDAKIFLLTVVTILKRDGS
ncbi:MAG: sugar transferase [Dehalococcoidales bacterium]|jgi:lipopolysaccharide/colanic/teichoic acid biosynthesis glycosyltransferase